jgi:ATP-dependent Lon protease
MVTSIVSVLTGIAVRKDIAMTGEVTLRGRVLPISGIKEKVSAAYRAGIPMKQAIRDDLAEVAKAELGSREETLG